MIFHDVCWKKARSFVLEYIRMYGFIFHDISVYVQIFLYTKTCCQLGLHGLSFQIEQLVKVGFAWNLGSGVAGSHGFQRWWRFENMLVSHWLCAIITSNNFQSHPITIDIIPWVLGYWMLVSFEDWSGLNATINFCVCYCLFVVFQARYFTKHIRP